MNQRRPQIKGSDRSNADWVGLDRLRPGHCGRVVEMPSGQEEFQLLMAMGVCVGRSVLVVQPGDPLIVRVLGSRIGVSARLAERVWVEPDAGAECAETEDPPCGR